MEGKLEQDALGNYLCDKCGKKVKWCTVKTSKLLLEWLGLGWHHRKQFHLCFSCASEFSDLVAKRGFK